MARKIQARRDELPQQLRELLYRHRTHHPSDVANAWLLERLIVAAEQPRAERQPAIQEEIPFDAYNLHFRRSQVGCQGDVGTEDARSTTSMAPGATPR